MHPGLSLVYHSQQNRSGSDTAAQKAAFRPAHCTARFGQGLWFPRTRPALLRAGVLPQTDQIRWLASGGFVPESRGCQCPVILPGACPLAQAPLLGSWPLALSDSDPPQLSVEPAYPGWGSSCYLSQATKLSSSCTFAWPYILCWLVILDPVGRRLRAGLWSQTAVVHGPSTTLTPCGTHQTSLSSSSSSVRRGNRTALKKLF